MTAASPGGPARRRATSGIVVVGDALIDRDIEGAAERLCPDAPVPVLDERSGHSRPGGAALVAALVAHDGNPVTLVTSLGSDASGDELRRLLSDHGVALKTIPSCGPTAEKIRFLAGDQPLLRLDRGTAPTTLGPVDPEVTELIEAASVVVVADYGRGLAALAEVRHAISRRRRPTLWDPHPRGGAPVPGVSLVTPNLAEMTALGSGPGLRAERIGDVAVAARDARQRWNVQAVAVTLGSAGALLIDGDGPPLVVPASPAGSGDTCGAGDRLVSATAGRLHHGALLSEALVDAVAEAGRFVAAGGARGFGRAAAARGALDLRQDGFGRAAAARGALDLRQDGPAPEGPEVAEGAVTPGVVGLAQARWGAERVRAGGGTVVVAGGCFDLLHAGHVALLQAARQLGDYLVVALNSDASVRRLKGPGRPVVPQADRAALLAAVRCVDAVVIFEEDGPEAVLEALRPHLFAKGGDYSARPLPESFILARWGGHAVVLPYLSGRSTTRVVEALGGPARAGDERGWP